jgi:hypothetical protein
VQAEDRVAADASNTGRLPDSVAADELSFFADTPVRLFDPFAPDTAAEFREFLSTTPMLNDRPMPSRAVRETSSALTMLQQRVHFKEPTYFVATNFEKTPLAPQPALRRRALAKHYGELLYPQKISPVFASHADAGVPSMLSAATGLAPGYFYNSPGSRENFHTLFLLTEASHCGFLNRYQAHETLPAGIETVADLRAVIEAVGDYEATAAFRSLQPVGNKPDEADVLKAARLVAMFLNDRVSAYTCIPALTIAFEAAGIVEGANRLAQIAQDVADARAIFRILGGKARQGQAGPALLRNIASAVSAALCAEASHADTRPSLTLELLARFPAAVAVVRGTDDPSARAVWQQQRPASPLLTLPGVVAWCERRLWNSQP